MFLGPQEHRELEAKYALEGCESSSRLTEGVLQVLGPDEKSVPGVLVAMAEGYERIPQFLVTSSSSARLTTDDIQERLMATPRRVKEAFHTMDMNWGPWSETMS